MDNKKSVPCLRCLLLGVTVVAPAGAAFAMEMAMKMAVAVETAMAMAGEKPSSPSSSLHAKCILNAIAWARSEAVRFSPPKKSLTIWRR